jgi:hypothetical protein
MTFLLLHAYVWVFTLKVITRAHQIPVGCLLAMTLSLGSPDSAAMFKREQPILMDDPAVGWCK